VRNRLSRLVPYRGSVELVACWNHQFGAIERPKFRIDASKVNGDACRKFDRQKTTVAGIFDQPDNGACGITTPFGSPVGRR
jgi:hypothetical protein